MEDCEDWNEEEEDCCCCWKDLACTEAVAVFWDMNEPLVVVAVCWVEDHSPARGGVWALTSVQPRLDSGRLETGETGESAKVTLRPRLLPLGTGLLVLDSRSTDISLCKKPSFFLLTKPVFTFPQPRP